MHIRKLTDKESICAGKTCSQEVCDAYALQFMIDFTLFLQSRGKEIIPGGWLVISIKEGRKCREYLRSEDTRMWDHISIILNKMAAQVKQYVIIRFIFLKKYIKNI